MPKEQPSPGRLEAFSDGVIAVIITIMVLDFKVPHDPGPAAFARAILPTLAVYFLSFTFTGIYWVNHHHLVHRIRHVNAPMLYGNLFFLFCLSLLPFATSYALEKHFDSFSVAVYAGALLLSGIGFIALSLAIGRHLHRTGGVEDPTDAAIQQAERSKAFLSLAMYALAMPSPTGTPSSPRLRSPSSPSSGSSPASSSRQPTKTARPTAPSDRYGILSSRASR
ncbi:TMEM175 family protein [Granulicella tundricola]|uniref:Integral membrane protein n=1 Tax=Granulicella tundricola (strain ATCC BAA-1859 / DSM 23138 / MP5ACTX9) TaxID=1198114 RepID=E8X412_GRATM|nr:TMEM175 family protein [Granulicella tundricola]ADW70520.1 protein of unknown function DUF1211 [Granulicella tundricola MP5ACTX9]